MRRLVSSLVLAVCVFIGYCQQATAQACTAISDPTPEYFGPMADAPGATLEPLDLRIRFGLGTEKCSLGTPGGTTTVCKDSDGNVEASFSTVLNVEQVPIGWATWSSPPDSESATPIVAWTSGTNLTVSFGDGLLAGIAGMEIEPNDFGLYTITAVFKNLAGVPILTVTRSVLGASGARLFAALCDEELIDKIDISAPAAAFGFAIAKVRADSFVINRDVPPAVPETTPHMPNATRNTNVIQPK